MDELAGLLGRERRLLEVLLFKLVEAHHLLVAGEVRFLPWAAAEAERAVERVREAELLRATKVRQLAKELDVDEERLTLKALADESLEPYRTIFDDHRNAFLELVAEIESVTQENRRLTGQGLQGINEVINLLTEEHDDPVMRVGKMYGPDTTSKKPRRPAPVRLDQAL